MQNAFKVLLFTILLLEQVYRLLHAHFFAFLDDFVALSFEIFAVKNAD